MTDKVELIALGRARVSGGGMGQLLMPLATFEQLSDDADPIAPASIFKGSARKLIVGGIYSVGGATIEDGRVTRVSLKGLTYERTASGPLIDLARAAELAEERIGQKEAAERKAKAAKDGLDRHIEALAEVAAKLPWGQRGSFISALTTEVQSRSILLAAKRRAA